MVHLKDAFSSSAREFKSLRSLIVTALFIALSLVLDSVSIYITPEIKIGVSFVAMALTAFLFGPVMGMAAGGVADVIGYVLNPRGAYFPGFTLSAVLGGLVYGLFLYRRPAKLLPIFAAKLLINLFINLFLNTLWNALLGGKGFFVLMPARAVKNLLLWPVESFILYFVLVGMGKILHRLGWRRTLL
ncbi:MAG: folate family ECF transporter S component [Eubacteriales bacterium]|nr:folate family ECF transporter S component [Eubacteriales bacterium]